MGTRRVLSVGLRRLRCCRQGQGVDRRWGTVTRVRLRGEREGGRESRDVTVAVAAAVAVMEVGRV